MPPEMTTLGKRHAIRVEARPIFGAVQHFDVSLGVNNTLAEIRKKVDDKIKEKGMDKTALLYVNISTYIYRNPEAGR